MRRAGYRTPAQAARQLRNAQPTRATAVADLHVSQTVVWDMRPRRRRHPALARPLEDVGGADSPDLTTDCRGTGAATGAPRPRQPAGLPPRRHPHPPLAHGVAHRLSGGWRTDPLPPRLPPHRRPQPDPRQRSERLERPNAHLYETGGLRRTHLRGHPNSLKRLRVHTGTFNVGLLMRPLIGVGTPRGLQGRRAAVWALVVAVSTCVVDLWRHEHTPSGDPVPAGTPQHRFELFPVRAAGWAVSP